MNFLNERKVFMSKSILVMDTPESCNKCDSCIVGGVVFCGINGKKIEQKVMNESKISEKCPLQDLPEKKLPRKIRGENLWGFYMPVFNKGFNSCIDEILKGGNGNE